MSDTSEFRVTIRLTPALYAQLQARGSHGQPLAAIVRQALVEYLARQPETPEQAVELATVVAAMAARLDGLQEQVEQLAARLETVAASGPPAAARPRQPRCRRRPARDSHGRQSRHDCHGRPGARASPRRRSRRLPRRASSTRR